MSNEPDSLLKPREMFKTFSLTGLAALLAATALTVATPARAQIGTIFSDPPPLRPPGNIPRGQPQPQQ
ncbi:signal peptide protein, partial [Bradyrhizobium sp. DOA1]